MKITKNMTIIEVMQKNPKAAHILFEMGLGCIGCHMAANETLEQGCLAHGMTRKQVDALIEKLNEKPKKKTSKRSLKKITKKKGKKK